jgi:DNA-binding CsgD family transcriptional regulator
MAPVVMLTDSGVSLIPAALSVYFNDEKYADRSVQHRKAILRLLYPAFRSAIRTYVDHRKNLEALRALGELAPIGVMWFDARGRGAHENEFFRRLMESDSERDRVRSEAASLARGIIYGPLHSSSSKRTSSEVHTKRGHYRMAATFIQDHTAPGPAIAVVVVERVEGRAMAARRLAEVYSFTRREIEIAELLRTGLSTKEIAAALGISVNTARRHLERIYLKLDVHTRASAAARLLDN